MSPVFISGSFCFRLFNTAESLTNTLNWGYGILKDSSIFGLILKKVSWLF